MLLDVPTQERNQAGCARVPSVFPNVHLWRIDRIGSQKKIQAIYSAWILWPDHPPDSVHVFPVFVLEQVGDEGEEGEIEDDPYA